MNENRMVTDLTQAYMQSYMIALDELHNPQLAVQVAMGVTTVYGSIIKTQQPLQGMDVFTQMILSSMAQGKKETQP